MVPDGDLSIDKVKGPEIGVFAGDGKCSTFYVYNALVVSYSWNG